MHGSRPMRYMIMANKQRHDRSRKESDRAHLEKLLDEGLKGTFPASDPVAIDIV